MIPVVQHNIPIRRISPAPGIIIWYCRISSIVKHVFTKGNYHNFRTMGNEIFSESCFTHPFLSIEEIKTANCFKSLKKQIEWISGRLVLKQLVFSSLNLSGSLSSIKIAYRDQGAPFLPDFPDHAVSLSHSGDITAAAICLVQNRRIGIDVETVAPMPSSSFLTTAFTREELEHLPMTPEAVFRQWTIKEAFLKYIQKGFNESLHKVEIIGGRIYHNKADTRIFFVSIDSIPGYILSIAADSRLAENRNL